MTKRSVSPLIATIILIALTVALGAIIVGWARGYVSGQVSCLNLGASAEYLSSDQNSTLGLLYIYTEVLNTGSVPININNVYIKIKGTNGDTDICNYNNSAGTCSFITISGYPITVNPSNYTEIEIIISNTSIVYNALAGAEVNLYSYSCNSLLSSFTLPASVYS